MNNLFGLSGKTALVTGSSRVSEKQWQQALQKQALISFDGGWMGG